MISAHIRGRDGESIEERSVEKICPVKISRPEKPQLEYSTRSWQGPVSQLVHEFFVFANAAADKSGS